MKIINIFYSIFFLASLHTINSHGALNNSFDTQDINSFTLCIKSDLWPYSEKLDNLIKTDSIQQIKEFFKTHPKLINQNICPDTPFPPLVHCLSYRKTSEQDLCDTVQTLIDCGANVNQAPNWIPHGNNYLPIIIAANHHTSDRLLTILLNHGAPANTQDIRGTLLQHLIDHACRLQIYIGNNEHPFTLLNQNKKVLPLIQKALEYGADPYRTNNLDKNAFDTLKRYKEQFQHYWKDYCYHAWRGTINHNNKTEYLNLLNQIESLLETKYLKPTQITKTDKKVHLTYNLVSSDFRFEPYDNQ